MIIYNDKEWPKITLILKGIINEFMYKSAKKTIDDIIKKCINEQKKCDLHIKLTEIEDYENYYICSILNYISEVNDNLKENINLLVIIANKSFQIILDNLIYLYPPEITCKIEYV